MGTQSISYATSITPAISSGNIITVGKLTGDITLNNATGTTNGEEVRVRFIQSEAGGNKVVLGSKWKLTSRDNNHPQGPNDVFYFYGITTSDGSIEGWFSPIIMAGMIDVMTTRGDIIYRNEDNQTARLEIGSAGHIITSDGTDLEWSEIPVTSVNGETGAVVLTTEDISEDTDKNYVTDAELALISHSLFEMTIAMGDEITDATAGTSKVTFRMPCAVTLTEVRASCNTAPVGSVATIDINEGGTSILSTKITIDASEKTSTTATTAPVISDTSLADDAEITVDQDGIGSSTAGKGYKITLIGKRA